MTLRAISLSLLAFLWFMPLAAEAQAPSATPAAAPSQPPLKPEELEALVSPIALYPDPLLSQVLIAATYPLEVVTADRWATQNKNLKGDQLKTEVDKQAWDESVKSLVATPEVLTMMSSKLEWTQKLGDAVLAQQPDLMDAIQRLRNKAYANNKLPSTKEQTVTVRQEQGKQVVVIQPTNPETVYVPYYDPAVVYGGWPYPAYPPYYWPAPGYIAGGLVATGLAFGAGYALGRWTSGGNYWGGGANWGNGNINVNRPININNSGNNWQHNPQHRQGVKYNNANVAQKFGQSGAGREARQDFRGKDGKQVLDPGRGGDRAGAGGRDGPGGDRAGAGGRDGPGGDRGGAGGRDGPGGDRGGAGKQAGQGGKQAGKGGNQGGGKQAGKGGGAKQPATRPSGGGGGGRDSAFSGGGSGGAARAQSSRGHASYGGGGAPRQAMGGGGPRGGGGGGFSGGGRGGGGFGGGGRGGGGGGRRSDIALKHDIVLLGHLDSGLGFYRFAYHGSDRAYVGVMAQEVLEVAPDAVVRGRDGYLRVYYDRLGLRFQTYDQWVASGSRIPEGVVVRH
jgi:uncharacterized protein DUF3300/endosialidase-like protein